MKWNNWTGADLRKRVRFFLPQYRLAAFLLLGASISNQVKGCGPDFPNWLLSLGDHAVLVAPEGSFGAELARMDLVPARFLAIPPGRTESYSEQSMEADLADLRRALKQSGMAEAEAGGICSEHQGQRKLRVEAIEARRAWEESHQNQDSSGDQECDQRRGDANPESAAFPRGHAQFTLDNGKQRHASQLAINSGCWQSFSARWTITESEAHD